MRVHIIQPTHFSIPFQKRLFKTDKRDLIPLTLPYLAALIPEGIETRITDEQVQDWDPEAPCDCVFISVHILNSFRAYEIADAYRQKGIPVVMGGPQCTFYGDEVLEHADAIAVGEAGADDHLLAGGAQHLHRSDAQLLVGVDDVEPA